MKMTDKKNLKRGLSHLKHLWLSGYHGMDEFGRAQVGHAFQTPVANDEAVFVLVRGCVSAFSHEGERLWSYNLPAGGKISIGSRLYKDKLLMTYFDEVICLNTKTGKEHYRFRVN